VPPALLESEDGIEFQFVSERGQLDHPDYAPREQTFLGSFISYRELDRYEQEMSDIEDELIRIGAAAAPIDTATDDFVRRVQEIIDSSHNVVRFTPTSKKDD